MTAIVRTEIRAPAQATAYMTSVLESSLLSLGPALLSRCDLSSGSMHVWAPADRPIPEDYGHGGLFEESPPDTWLTGPGCIIKPKRDTFGTLADEIVRALRDDDRHAALVANELLEPSYPVARTFAASTVLRGELYHFFNRHLPRDAIHRDLRFAHALPVFYGFLSKTSAAPWAPAPELPESVFQDLVANTTSIFVGAFDGESFMMWRSAAETEPVSAVRS